MKMIFDNQEHLYIQIADRIKSWISEGTYLPGTKIPSMRELSSSLKVSVSTVIQTYQLLERTGYIEARPQSGYYVKHRPFLEEAGIKSRPQAGPRHISSNNTFLDVIRTCGNTSIVPLGAAIIDPSLLPTEYLQKSLLKMARLHGADFIRYEVNSGHWPLRQELSKRTLQMGFDAHAEDINITAGCMEAINLALKCVTKPGDIVAVESPTYYGQLHAIENLGLKILELASSSDKGLDLDCLEEKLKKYPVKALLITPSFSNPLGSLMDDESKHKCVEICRKYNVVIIEDDIYGELNFEGNRPLALKSFDKHENVIYCSSFSKTLAPGYRIGWIIPPQKYMERIEMIKFSQTVTANSPAQMAIADHLKNNNHERLLRKLRQTLAQNMVLYSKKILDTFPEGTRITTPKGGCLLWVELPKNVNALSLHQKALKHKIGIIPGPVFSSNGKYQNFIRMNTGALWGERTEKAVEKIARLTQG